MSAPARSALLSSYFPSRSVESASTMVLTSLAAKVSQTPSPSAQVIHRNSAVGLATSFLGGSKEEWSLVRRHPSESIFGVQVAGNKPSTLVPTAEVIGKELAGNIDFVDVNCGCPIDLVFKTGSGSARTSFTLPCSLPCSG